MEDPTKDPARLRALFPRFVEELHLKRLGLQQLRVAEWMARISLGVGRWYAAVSEDQHVGEAVFMDRHDASDTIGELVKMRIFQAVPGGYEPLPDAEFWKIGWRWKDEGTRVRGLQRQAAMMQVAMSPQDELPLRDGPYFDTSIGTVSREGALRRISAISRGEEKPPTPAPGHHSDVASTSIAGSPVAPPPGPADRRALFARSLQSTGVWSNAEIAKCLGLSVEETLQILGEPVVGESPNAQADGPMANTQPGGESPKTQPQGRWASRLPGGDPPNGKALGDSPNDRSTRDPAWARHDHDHVDPSFARHDHGHVLQAAGNEARSLRSPRSSASYSSSEREVWDELSRLMPVEGSTFEKTWRLRLEDWPSAVRAAVGETRMAGSAGRINKSAGGFLNDQFKRFKMEIYFSAKASSKRSS